MTYFGFYFPFNVAGTVFKTLRFSFVSGKQKVKTGNSTHNLTYSNHEIFAILDFLVIFVFRNLFR